MLTDDEKNQIWNRLKIITMLKTQKNLLNTIEVAKIIELGDDIEPCKL